MNMGFRELLELMGVFFLLSLANSVPFLVYLYRKSAKDEARDDLRERERETRKFQQDAAAAKTCHDFQNGLNEQNLKAFGAVTNAMTVNSQVLSELMNRLPPTLPPKP